MRLRKPEPVCRALRSRFHLSGVGSSDSLPPIPVLGTPGGGAGSRPALCTAVLCCQARGGLREDADPACSISCLMSGHRVGAGKKGA